MCSYSQGDSTKVPIDKYRELILCCGEGNAAVEELRIYKSQREKDSALIASLTKENGQLKTVNASLTNSGAIAEQERENLRLQMQVKDNIIQTKETTIKKLVGASPKNFSLAWGPSYNYSFKSQQGSFGVSIGIFYSLFRF